MSSSDYLRITEDRHQQALYRLAAIGQYLYDTMNGGPESDRYDIDLGTAAVRLGGPPEDTVGSFAAIREWKNVPWLSDAANAS